MTLYSHARPSGQKDLLRRSRSGRWRAYRLDRAEWFELSPPLAASLEKAHRAKTLALVAACVLGGKRVEVAS